MDTGSDYNLISRSFLEEHSQLEQYTKCPSLTAVGNLPIPTFGVYPLYLKTRDALGYEHTYLLRFIVADIAPFTLILGEPWLKMAKPLFDFDRKTWTYPPEQRHLGLQVEPKQPWSACGFVVAAVTPYVDETLVALHPAPPAALPATYAAYSKLFDTSTDLPLPHHHALEHRIDLEDGAQPP